MLTRAVDTNTFELAEGSLQASAWAASPADTERARAAAVKAAAKECGEGRMAAGEESMAESAAAAAGRSPSRAGRAMADVHETTSRGGVRGRGFGVARCAGRGRLRDGEAATAMAEKLSAGTVDVEADQNSAACC